MDTGARTKWCMYALCGVAVLGLMLAVACTSTGPKEGQLRAAGAEAQSDSELGGLEQAAQAHPDDPDSFYQLGNAYFDEERYAEAEASYRQALTLRPDYAAAYCNLGLSLRRQGNLREAVDAYHMALQYEPDDVTTITNLVAALRELGDWEAAADQLDHLAEIEADDVYVWSELANLLFRLDRYEDAAYAYKQVIHLDPGMSSDYYNLGLCHLEMDNPDAALTTWLTALAYDPKNASARKGLAVVYWQRGDYDQAWEAVEECQKRGIRLDPEFITRLQEDSGRAGPGGR